MSAYQVDRYHIGALLRFWEAKAISRNCRAYWRGEGKCWTSDTLAEPFATLAQQNFASVAYRYQDSQHYKDATPTSLPVDECGEPVFKLSAYFIHPAIEIIKGCNCLEYQSCETSDYYESHAYAILDAIRRCAIQNLTGYEDANGWDLTPPKTRGLEC